MNPSIVFLLLSLTLFPMVLATSDCFCLEDNDDNFRHSCYEQRQGYHVRIQCRDEAGEPYQLDDVTGWTRLSEGEGRCSPCNQRLDIDGDPIRGDNDQTAEHTGDDRTE